MTQRSAHIRKRDGRQPERSELALQATERFASVMASEIENMANTVQRLVHQGVRLPSDFQPRRSRRTTD